MASMIRITVDGQQELLSAFNSDNAIAANIRSLNRSVITARKETVKQIQKKVRLGTRQITRVALAYKATRNKPFASVFIGGKKRFGSVHFAKRKLSKGYSVAIYPGGTTKFPIAFKWERAGRTIILQRQGRKRKPLMEPVREKNIRLGEIILDDADKVQRVFVDEYLRIMRREIEVRNRGVV